MSTVRCICGHVARDFDDALTHVIESAGLPGGPHEVWNPDPPNETVAGERIIGADASSQHDRPAGGHGYGPS